MTQPAQNTDAPRVAFRCSDHGEQEVKDALMVSERRALLIELNCSCVFRLSKTKKGITQKRLTFRQGTKRPA